MVIVKVGLREFLELPGIRHSRWGHPVYVPTPESARRQPSFPNEVALSPRQKCDEVLAAELTGIRRRDKGEPR
jgi:hypothetical protein